MELPSQPLLTSSLQIRPLAYSYEYYYLILELQDLQEAVTTSSL